jgi:hypothetical protein
MLPLPLPPAALPACAAAHELLATLANTRHTGAAVLAVLRTTWVPASCRRSLPSCQAVIEEAFRGLHGRTLNFNSMVRAVGQLNRWYEDKGVLGQVRGAADGGEAAGGGQHSALAQAAASHRMTHLAAAKASSMCMGVCRGIPVWHRVPPPSAPFTTLPPP